MVLHALMNLCMLCMRAFIPACEVNGGIVCMQQVWEVPGTVHVHECIVPELLTLLISGSCYSTAWSNCSHVDCSCWGNWGQVTHVLLLQTG